jgi:exo-1,4-beta-D-glucosaminidase
MAADGKTHVTLTVTNPTDQVAYLLHLSLRTPKGKLIDGVTFSDNYISLAPHSSCNVTCEFVGQQKFRPQIDGNKLHR